MGKGALLRAVPTRSPRSAERVGTARKILHVPNNLWGGAFAQPTGLFK